MTEKQYYEKAEKKIAELKAKGINPAMKIFGYRSKAINSSNGKFKFELKDAYLKKDENPLKMELVDGSNEWILNYGNGVKCMSWPKFFYAPASHGNPTELDERIALELMAMAYNMDITWKQYAIDTARAEGMDV